MRIFKQVPRIIFGRGALDRITELLPPREENGYYIFVIDAIHRAPEKDWVKRLPIQDGDLVEWFDAVKEPSTAQVDALRVRAHAEDRANPLAVIGIGGGASMDVAKALAVILNNPGGAAEYQGWDLVPNPAVRKIGVPTLSGSGAEASRTAVLMGKDKKFGINSDYSMLDAILLDSSLTDSVPVDQWFHSGMDCYIHCVESLEGTMINELSRSYAARAMELCEKAR